MSDLLLERALQWIDAHLDEFDPIQNPHEFDFNRGQRLGELAILARTAARAGRRANDPRVHRMVTLLQRTQSSSVYSDRLMRAPTELMLFVETYVTLRVLGTDDERMRARLEKAISGGWLHQTERFPHRAMDIRSCLDECGISCGLAPLDELYRQSILGTPPNPILLNEHDLYALTHVVMFISDFGMRRADAMPEHHREEVAALLGALTVVAARHRHWDLLAEFLLCWSCLDFPETGLIARAWDALSRAQRADGAVPGPEVSSAAADIPDVSFEHVYHTTLVSALAASIREGKVHGVDHHAQQVTIGRPVDLKQDDTQAAAIALRSRAWLMDIAAKELATPTSSALRLAQVLTGLSCCAALADEELPQTLVDQIAGRMQQVTTAEWAAMPPLLECVSAAYAADAGVFVEALHGPDSFLRRARAFFERTPPCAGPQRMEMNEIWNTLHQLGIAPAPSAVSHDEIDACARELALDSDARRVDDMVLLLDAATACGTRQISLDGACAYLPELVTGLAIDACRRYDLMKASDLLRTATAIAGDARASRALRLGIDYLIFNQREDGAFGFFGPETATRTEWHSAADESADLLPLTVTCLLTLAAYFRGWHVVSDLGSRGATTRSMLMDARQTREGFISFSTV